jgi:hypothetical protein
MLDRSRPRRRMALRCVQRGMTQAVMAQPLSSLRISRLLWTKD